MVLALLLVFSIVLRCRIVLSLRQDVLNSDIELAKSTDVIVKKQRYEHCFKRMTDMKESFWRGSWSSESRKTDMAERDASCQEGLLCARKGYDGRTFGDCPDFHCCSVPPKFLYDTSCREAGSNMTERDASCDEGLVCARNGYDGRDFGDCADEHCCSHIPKLRYDRSCYDAGSNMTERDASCLGDLVCAKKGKDGRKFGDCPRNYCCSDPHASQRTTATTTAGAPKPRYDKSCYKAGSNMTERDASCQEGLFCARRGSDGRNFGDCLLQHCCSDPNAITTMTTTKGPPKPRYDRSCYKAGSNMTSRDASCQEGLYCARRGYDGRDFGDCPRQYCCSDPDSTPTTTTTTLGAPKPRYDKSCYRAGSNMTERDASCQEGLYCARRGSDGRNFGDCPRQHCCSDPDSTPTTTTTTIGAPKPRYDNSCYRAGSNMTSRDASCQEGLFCARRGHDGRNFGDCTGQHCCSDPSATQTTTTTTMGEPKLRYDTSCYRAGSNMTERDASCAKGLSCARKGYDGRKYGDCPSQHCCSEALFLNDLVIWYQSNEDIPAGSVGKIIGFSEKDETLRIEFSSGTYNFNPQSLVKAAKPRYDTSCYSAATNKAARDALCSGKLVCARDGSDGRNFGDCPRKHCCSEDRLFHCDSNTYSEWAEWEHCSETDLVPSGCTGFQKRARVHKKGGGRGAKYCPPKQYQHRLCVLDEIPDDPMPSLNTTGLPLAAEVWPDLATISMGTYANGEPWPTFPEHKLQPHTQIDQDGAPFELHSFTPETASLRDNPDYADHLPIINKACAARSRWIWLGAICHGYRPPHDDLFKSFFGTEEAAVGSDCAYLFRHRGADAVAIAFRGTDSAHNWKKHCLQREPKATEEGYLTQTGFFAYYDGFRKENTTWQAGRDHVYAITWDGWLEMARQAKQVWITGHSLGGAAAVLHMTDLQDNLGICAEEGKCGVVTFGQPKMYLPPQHEQVVALRNYRKVFHKGTPSTEHCACQDFARCARIWSEDDFVPLLFPPYEHGKLNSVEITPEGLVVHQAEKNVMTVCACSNPLTNQLALMGMRKITYEETVENGHNIGMYAQYLRKFTAGEMSQLKLRRKRCFSLAIGPEDPFQSRTFDLKIRLPNWL